MGHLVALRLATLSAFFTASCTMSGWSQAPKLMGFVICGPAALLGGVQGMRFYRNYTATDEEKAAGGDTADERRKQGIADRLTANPSTLGNINAKHLEKMIKTNSALSRERAEEVREAHGSSQTESLEKILKTKSALAREHAAEVRDGHATNLK